MKRLSRDAAAMAGASAAGESALVEWAAKYGFTHCGASVRVGVERETITVGDARIGPLASWRAASAVPWLGWVESVGGEGAAIDAAHALGLSGTGRYADAARRNYWYAGPHSRGPCGAASGVWYPHPAASGGTCYSVAPMYVSAYLACMGAAGIRPDDEELAAARAWESSRLASLVTP